MKQELYNNIIRAYRNQKQKRTCLKTLCEFFPMVPEDALENIISQEYQRATKKSHHRHHSQAKHYYDSFSHRMKKSPNPGFLTELADEVGMSPSLFAKLILEQHFIKKNNGKKISRTEITGMLKDTTTINEPYLAVEVHLANINDELYGPITDAMRGATGKEYEEKLKKELNNLGITYVDEEDLKLKGYDKTPDIKLDLPVVIDGYLVNWIESKASFGDDENHTTYLKEQYTSYCNRFGPGLVIYWFGFIEELNVHQDQGIILYNSYPLNITFMDPLLLMKTE